MAVTASRTLANVKSSAISPRHPDVPNLMGVDRSAIASVLERFAVVAARALDRFAFLRVECLIALYSSPARQETKAVCATRIPSRQAVCRIQILSGGKP